MLANGERPSREQLREAAQHAGMREGQRANPQVQKWLTERMLREMNLTPEQLRDAIEVVDGGAIGLLAELRDAAIVMDDGAAIIRQRAVFERLGVQRDRLIDLVLLERRRRLADLRFARGRLLGVRRRHYEQRCCEHDGGRRRGAGSSSGLSRQAVHVLGPVAAALGGGILYAPPDATPPALVRELRQSAITHASGTPSLWRKLLLALSPDHPITSLKNITLGGEAVDQVTLDRLNHLLAHVCVDEAIAGPDSFGRGEAPLIAAADQERVLGGRLEATVDDDQPLVLAEPDAGHAGGLGVGVRTLPAQVSSTTLASGRALGRNCGAGHGYDEMVTPPVSSVHEGDAARGRHLHCGVFAQRGIGQIADRFVLTRRTPASRTPNQ